MIEVKYIKILLKFMARISKFILPYGIYRILVFIANYFISKTKFLMDKRRKLLEKNIILNGEGNGKRAFLLATGPSIKNENLKLLKGEDCFTVSNAFLLEDIQIINPKYHFFAPYHEPLILENYIEWLKKADKTLPDDTKIFLGISTYEIVKENNLFSGREVFYLYLSDFVQRTKIDLVKPVLAPQTVPLMVLPVLLYMGYEEIYLLGCDHTVLRDYKRTIKHFFEKDADIRKNASDINAWHGIIESHRYSCNIFLQYKFYKIINESFYKTKISNISKDSWLDFFPFIRLEDLFVTKNSSLEK